MASMLRMVSRRLSPLETELVDVEKLSGDGRQPFFGKFEGNAGAGAVFEEKIDDGLAAQRGHLLDFALQHLVKIVGSVEDEGDVLFGHAFQAEKVLDGKWPWVIRPPRVP